MKTTKPETPAAQGREQAKGSASTVGGRMPEAAARIMEQDLRNLEFHIEELIQVCDRLREENAMLRGQQTSLLAERAQLIKKTEVVSSRVESMILRFKSMEYDA